MIQACQALATQGLALFAPRDECESDPAVPSQSINPHYNKHIVLRRPHTVLLLSIVTGGLAIKGAFTGAIADELRKSDGKTYIYSMFTLTVNKLVRSQSLQRPEMRSTADKFLVLPPALNNAAESTATAGVDN